MGAKMADEAARSIEEAHNKTVNTTDQSANVRKELKAINENLSTLRTLFVKMQATLKGSRQKEQTETHAGQTLREC